MSGVAGWVVVVPLKLLSVAKSRLPGPPAARASLALAMAADTVRAARSCPLVSRVVVVTSDQRAGAVLAPWADLLADRPGGGLSAAVESAAAAVRAGAGPAGVAVLTADLPALTGQALTDVLTAAAGTARSFVADADGIGTVLLAATGPAPLGAAFEGESAGAHRRGGAVELSWRAGPGLRRDVDTAADLRAALALTPTGFGRTAAAAAAAGWLAG